jgi:hypothetical protein
MTEKQIKKEKSRLFEIKEKILVKQLEINRKIEEYIQSIIDDDE